MPLTTTSSVGAALKRGMQVPARTAAAVSEDSDSSSCRRSRSSIRHASPERFIGRKAAASSPSRCRSRSRGQQQLRGPPRNLRRTASGPGRFDRREDRSPARRHSRTCGQRAPPQRNGRIVECWFGRQCSRMDCWFAHPDGRFVDEKREKKAVERKRQRASSSSSSPPRRPSRPSLKRSALRQKRSASRQKRSASRQSRSASRQKRSASRQKRSASRQKRSPARSASSASRKTSRSASASAASARSASERCATPRSVSRSKVRTDSSSEVSAEVQTSTTASFRDFVLQNLGDDATPDTAIAMFEEYQKDLVKKQMEAIKGTGLFRDLYHPLSVLRQFDLHARSAQRAAEGFLKDLTEGRYEGICLSASTPGSPTCPTNGHLKSPQFAFDPDVNALLVEGIPPALSVWTIHDDLTQAPGITSIAWSKPLSTDAARELRACFASKENAQAALEALAKAATKFGPELKLKLLEPSADLSAVVLPPEMSHPERLEKDSELSAQIIRVLDAFVGVPPETSEALLGREAPTAEALDLQVLYLRRVHHFCFYAASWCNDEWDLRKRCGAVALRDGGSGKPVEEGDLAKAHEERVRNFLVNTEFQRPQVLDICREHIAAKREAVCQENTEQVVEGKFKCGKCKKYFKGVEYVHKHLQKAHSEVFEEIQSQVYNEAAADAFLSNPLPAGNGSTRA